MAVLWSIGHGSRTPESLLDCLVEAGVECLVDVRAVPRSRRHPQFGYGPLGAHLATRGLRYDWRGKALGGLRRGSDSQRHDGLADPAFRAYAEYMEGPAFREAASTLAREAGSSRLCLMCAERDPAQCHRSLISDWMVAHGHRVVHLLEPGRLRDHVLHPSARLEGDALHFAARSPQGRLF